MIKNQWYAILPSKAIGRNKILGIKRLNLELAIFRDKSGKIGCMVDRCSHRGAALSGGKIKNECIKCPFHGLEYDAEGRCTHIPANGRSSLGDISKFNVHEYKVKEKNGIIYLWYGDDEKITEDLPFFDEFIDETYSYSEIKDIWNAHYSRCIENQLDIIHLPFVHKTTIGRGNKTLVNEPHLTYEKNMISLSSNNEVDIGQIPQPAEKFSAKKTALYFKYPNMWQNLVSDKIKILIYFAPVDDENTILYIRFYCKITNSKIVNNIIAYFGKFANRVIEKQDKRVVITQKPKKSSLKSKEKLLKGDSPIIMYRKIREELKNNSI